MSDQKPSSIPTQEEAAASLANAMEGPGEAVFEHQNSAWEDFLDKYGKILGIGVVGVFAATAGVIIARNMSASKAHEQGSVFSKAENIADFDKIIESQKDTPTAGSAQFQKANLLAKDANKLGDAITHYEKFMANFPKHPLVDQAEFRIAMLTGENYNLEEKDAAKLKEEATKAAESAISKLEAFLTKYPSSAFAPMAWTRKGDLLAQIGKADEAKKAYESTKSRELFANALIDGKGTLGNTIKERLEKVELKAPDLVEFKPEPAPPPTPGGGAPIGFPTAPGSLPTEINTPSINLDGGAGGSPISITPGGPAGASEIKLEPSPAPAPAPAPTPSPAPAQPAPAPANPAPATTPGQ